MVDSIPSLQLAVDSIRMCTPRYPEWLLLAITYYYIHPGERIIYLVTLYYNNQRKIINTNVGTNAIQLV